MLSPDYLSHVSDDILRLYEEYQTSVVAEMARRIARMERASSYTAYQAQIMQESGVLFNDIVREIADLTTQSDREVREMFEAAGVTALRYDDNVYKTAGLTPLPIQQSPALLNILTAGVQKTQGNLRNLTMTTATQTQAAFIQASNLAYMQVSTGAMDYNRAVTLALRQMAEQGVTIARYDKNGRVHIDKIDVAVRRATITGVNQTAGQLQWTRADEMGCDLVETSAHFGARPTHAEWQGQVFSRSGQHLEYPDFVDTTGYGSGDGLMGWNCRHSFFPFFDGLSTPAYSTASIRAMDRATVTYNDKQYSLYDATQMQRQMERKVREYKRELAANAAAMQATADPSLQSALRDEFNRTSVSLKAKERQLREFLKQTDLNRQREREQAVGFGRSEASRAVWANRKS